jgi:hypothetical protein
LEKNGLSAEKIANVITSAKNTLGEPCIIARKFLYLAALRLLVNDPMVKKWYEAKKDERAKLKTVLALMRKLPLALWHRVRRLMLANY